MESPGKRLSKETVVGLDRILMPAFEEMSKSISRGEVLTETLSRVHASFNKSGIELSNQQLIVDGLKP